ncbi:MAG: hypothetical protein C5B50_12835 [Verrucomicrobia bacterium]|nr:MAG: hypothetical protein C5B50_12835 [Verrucomicrobiota bacterium]
MSILRLPLPEKLNQRLTLAARRSGKTPARFVRETVEARLAKADLPLTEGPSLYARSRDLCGSVSGGPRDLASNKKHLNGYGAWKR